MRYLKEQSEPATRVEQLTRNRFYLNCVLAFHVFVLNERALLLVLVLVLVLDNADSITPSWNRSASTVSVLHRIKYFLVVPFRGLADQITQRQVLLGELRYIACRKTKEVVSHQHLAIDLCAGTDADGGHF